MTIDELKIKCGECSYNGKLYVLVQNAYCTNGVRYGEACAVYEACAICPEDGEDEDGYYQVYMITWYPIEYDEDDWRGEDEENACNWDEPDDIRKLGCAGYDMERNIIV